jgi:hypothetical protein
MYVTRCVRPTQPGTEITRVARIYGDQEIAVAQRAAIFSEPRGDILRLLCSLCDRFALRVRLRRVTSSWQVSHMWLMLWLLSRGISGVYEWDVTYCTRVRPAWQGWADVGEGWRLHEEAPVAGPLQIGPLAY